MKHTINGYITHRMYNWETTPAISFQDYKPCPEISPETVVIKEHSFEVDVPDNFDPRPQMIDGLREQEKKAMADFEFAVSQIRKRISELQAIEFTAPA